MLDTFKPLTVHQYEAAELTADTLSILSDLRPGLSRAEVHLYNIRHIQPHTSQVSLRL